MSAKTEYSMFSDAGNADVAKIVKTAQTQNLTWPQTYKLLEQLSKKRNRAEALDTDVRLQVYGALKYSTSIYSFQFED